jgi:hypothetical protein
MRKNGNKKMPQKHLKRAAHHLKMATAALSAPVEVPVERVPAEAPAAPVMVRKAGGCVGKGKAAKTAKAACGGAAKGRKAGGGVRKERAC